MHSLKYKIIYTSISITAFLIALSAFVFGFSQIDTEMAFLRNIAPYGFILLSVGLLFIWQGLGQPGGLIFFALSAPLVVLVSLGLKSPIYNFQILIMIGITIPSYLFYKRGNGILLEEDEKTGKVREKQNILDDRMKKDAGLTQALSQRIDRYNKLKDLGEAFNAKLSSDNIYQLTIDRAYEIIGKTDEAKLFLVTKPSLT